MDIPKNDYIFKGYLKVSSLYVKFAGSKFDLRKQHSVEFEKPGREIVFFFKKAHHFQDIHASSVEFLYSTC